MGVGGLVSRVDRAVGAAAERASIAHHRRRLRRLGCGHVVDAPAGGWARGEPPPRRGNDVEVLADGAEAPPRIADAIESAESHVHLAGWHFSPELALRRDARPVVLRNLLAETAERVDVRVLAWAGAPLPLFRPTRQAARAVQAALRRNSKVDVVLDGRERPLHCHHEKLAVVRPLADEQLRRLGRGAPLEHRLVRLPPLSRRASRLRGPLDSLLVDS
jgi:phosphatidylserine/phosphatidylglycerophosphate/cardiolipin synthase-like enzyme